MAHLRNLRSRHFHALLKPQNPTQNLKIPLQIPLPTTTHYKSSIFSSIFHRPMSLLAQFEAESSSSDNSNEDNTKPKKPLHVLFMESVGLSEKTPEHVDIENDVGTNELQKRLRKLEEEVRRLEESRLEEEVGRMRESGSDRETPTNSRKKSSKDVVVSKSEPKFKSLNPLFAKNGGDGEKSEVVKTPKNLRKKSSNDLVVSKSEPSFKSLNSLYGENGGDVEISEDVKTSMNSRKKSSNDVVVSKSKPSFKSMYSLFAKNAAKNGGDDEKSGDVRGFGMEDTRVYKELSPEMVMFVTHLYRKGYFNNANFFPRNKFDVTCFENAYGRDFIKHAAEKFGKDNQEIAKWLSASDLKKVALFGCPSLGRKTIFSAKRLRIFFVIEEKTVCTKCVLKPSCEFVNQSVWKGDNKNLNLAVLMRVITLYALESVHPQLVVPDEIRDSVNRLLKEVVNLSQTPA